MIYKAKQGDIIWLDFDPQTGHETAKRRPALVVSNDTFNDMEKYTAMVCPITNTDRGSSIQPRLDNRTKTRGFIMCNQARILDLQARNPVLIEKAPEDTVFEAVDLITGFLEMETD